MLKSIIRHLARTFAHLGGPGVLALSALDSSPLFIPFGNDLLFIAISAGRHQMMLYYALMGSSLRVAQTLTSMPVPPFTASAVVKKHMALAPAAVPGAR
jgi:hypothetical protein